MQAYLENVAPPRRRRDAETLVDLMRKVTGQEPRLRGTEKLGPHTTGVGCIYIKDLGQVDVDVLLAIVALSHATLTAGTFTDRARDSG